MKECPKCGSCFGEDMDRCPQDGEATKRTLSYETVIDGRYQLERRLGQGAMGVVYLTTHRFLKTQFAIKIILPELVGNDPMLATRFRQEAVAAASIRHRNIIAVTDFGILQGTTPYLVMEYLRGPSLHDLIESEGPMSTARALEIIRPLVDGVAAAHRQGVIHRDLKPLNVMLQEGLPPAEGLRVLDFGLAKIKSGELLGSFIQAQTTGLMGSPWYMAPEQWGDEEPTALADLYSLGIIVYQMLAGEVPFKGSSIPAVMKKHLSNLPPSFTSFGVEVPPEIERVVVRALEKEPSKRQQSVEEFLEEFEKAAADGGIIARSTTTARLATMPLVVPETNVDATTSFGAFSQESYRPVTSDVEPGGSTIFRPPRESTVVQGNLTLHMERIEREVSSAPENFSSTVLLRHSEVVRHTGEHIFEDLVLHKDYERLWRSLIHAGGGCNLLTGYGPFGGTSLVRCAIERARGELSRRVELEAALLVFYFTVVTEDKDSFKLEATKFGLEHLNRPKNDLDDTAFNELKERAEQGSTDESLLNFNLDNPLGQTFFNPRAKIIPVESKQQTYDFANLIDDLNTYFREQKSSKALHQIISSLVKSECLPSRVVFIIDRVRHLETLEALSASDLFSNKRIRVIVVSRKEDFDSWPDGYNRLERINFLKWYVPCLWNIDFNQVLFRTGPEKKPPPEPDWTLFLKHLEFSCRGSLGNIIAELRYARNINFAEDGNYIDVTDLSRRVDIQHNAWLQNLLELNWGTVLSDHFVGFDQDEKTDRARIGVYYLIDWLARKHRFTKEEIVTQARQTKITISDDEDIRLETVEALLYVLTTSRYLLKNTRYRVVWDRDRPPEIVKIPRKRTRDLQEPVTAAFGQAVQPVNLLAAHQTPFTHGTELQSPGSGSNRSSLVERWAKSVLSLFNSQPAPSSPAPPANDYSVGKSEQPGASPQETPKQETLVAAAPRAPVKTIHKTINQKIEYFADADSDAGKIKMLIVFASPKGSDPLRLGDEDRIIRGCLERCRYRENFREKIIHAARIEDFQRELVDQEYHIVHFSGHGVSTGQLAFEDEGGQIKLVPQKALSDLLLEFPSIQCVILNACYSLNQGRMISLGVPFTIAMNTAISDDASQYFSRGFYDSIGAGRGYEFAYKMGCKAIALEGLSEESTPTLFKK